MPKIGKWIGQGLLFMAFAAVIGYFSALPRYTYIPEKLAQIKVNFSHGGERVVECRRFTAEELTQLAPNMRREFDCPRERVPLHFQLRIDDEIVFDDDLPPSGIAKDGNSNIYRRFIVEPGQHRIEARLRDSRRESGFDYEASEIIDLYPGQNFVIDFRADTGGFRFL